MLILMRSWCQCVRPVKAVLGCLCGVGCRRRPGGRDRVIRVLTTIKTRRIRIGADDDHALCRYELARASDRRIVFSSLPRVSEVFAALIWRRLRGLPRYDPPFALAMHIHLREAPILMDILVPKGSFAHQTACHDCGFPIDAESGVGCFI